jgi:hypothetical protein
MIVIYLFDTKSDEIFRYSAIFMTVSIILSMLFQLFLPSFKSQNTYESNEEDILTNDNPLLSQEERVEAVIDQIDFEYQNETANKIYETMGPQHIFIWKSSQYSDRDIGGTFFDTCPHCGGEKEYSKGDDDYGDTTEQYVSCNLCGWRGYRRIKYQRYEKEPSTIYKKSILFELKEDEPKYHTILKQYFPYELKTIESFYIDWKNKQVLFKLFTVDDKYTIEILDFKKADELFQALELYNPLFSKKSILNVEV